MTLEQFIDDFGASRLARELKVNPSTISYWKRVGKRRSFPRPAQIKKLRELSGGRLDANSMVEEFLKKSK